MSKSAMIPKESVITISNLKALVAKFDLVVIWSRSIPKVITWKNWVPNATYPLSWKSVHWFQRCLKGFYHIWVWQPSRSFDQYHVDKFSFPCTKKLIYQIWLQLSSGFWEKKVLICICKWPWAKVKKRMAKLFQRCLSIVNDDDRQTSEPKYTISSPKPSAQVS